MSDQPEWWRGETPPLRPRGQPGPGELITGRTGAIVRPSAASATGLSGLYFFRATLTNVELSLTGTHLTVEWSEFDRCEFGQRVKPVLNDLGIATQGSFGSGPALYRECTFERVRFKLLGGFSMGRARFENCTFLNCRWEGHFAYDADLVENRFVGRMNGCVWFGSSDRDGGVVRPNIIRDNDFSQTNFTSNVAFRSDFPVANQLWPAKFVPLVD